jgi:hypothetical protein
MPASTSFQSASSEALELAQPDKIELPLRAAFAYRCISFITHLLDGRKGRLPFTRIRKTC